MWAFHWLCGCSDQGLSYAKPREVCASTYFASEPATPIDPGDRWALQERWSTGFGVAVFRVAAAPFRDTDGDGEVGPGDRMDIVTSDPFEDRLWLIDGTTGDIVLTVPGADFDLADVDSTRPGVEIVVSKLRDDGERTVRVADRSGVFLTSTLVGEEDGYYYDMPVEDLEGDGLYELIGQHAVYDFATGEPRFSFPQMRVSPASVADLDGDGRAELVMHFEGDDRIRIYEPDGTVSGTCPFRDGPDADEYWWAAAIANFDEDPELEVIHGGMGGLVVCDADGTIVAENHQPVYGTISVAQLDADREPEVVVSDFTRILGFEHDLQPMTSPIHDLGSGSYSVVDLDGDGIHEVLAWSPVAVTVTRATGTPLAYYPFGNVEFNQGRHLPMVVDLDADGLAEIVVPDWRGCGVTVLDNPLGGWVTPGSDLPWRGLHGSDSLPPRGPEDFVGGANVWNGRPVVEPACSASVALEVRDVCVDRCDEDAVLTVYVVNRGALPLSEALEVEIWSGGERVAAAPVPSVPAETAVPVQVAVSTSALRGAIEARLGGPVDTDCAVAVSGWDEPVCE